MEMVNHKSSNETRIKITLSERNTHRYPVNGVAVRPLTELHLSKWIRETAQIVRPQL